ARGETMGTFQLGGSGMTRWLKELKPTTVDDIMAMVALYRPGPMESIPEYIRRKHDPSLVEYLDPRMRDYLGASFGLLVYQDDVLLTAIHLAGYDWVEADKFRKAIGKKIPEEMEKQKIKFSQGCRAHGKLPSEKIERLWQLIEPFAAYGFNKAHAASYGIVAYQTAYLKAHFPVQYMTAVLQAEAGDADKVAAIVHECRRLGIEVMPPDVNESWRNFAMISAAGAESDAGRVRGRIRFGLTAIKNVGEHLCGTIYEERKSGGSYRNLEDFLTRVRDKDLNKKSLESLIQAGALDGFGHDRAKLLGSIEQLLLFMRDIHERQSAKQHSLFSGTDITVGSTVALREAAPATLDEKLVWEKKLLGLYVSSHPFAAYEGVLRSVVTPAAELDGYPRDRWIVVAGIVGALKKKITKKGSVMLFANVEDISGTVELLVFPKTYESTQSLWREGSILCIVGKTPKEDGDAKVFVENVHPVTADNVQSLARQLSLGRSPAVETAREPIAIVAIDLTAEELRTKAEALKCCFAAHPGEAIVFLRVGGKSIRTKSGVKWDQNFVGELESIVGTGRASFVNSGEG
ncbi:MAG: hypothetical protein HY984_02435, partial [Candidatus Magasanikbacteria bacterium]|nr:hypothetical protein [Candidatus Magasanikbacteria bacterium]